MGDEVWFVHHAGSQLGPMSWSELQTLAARGEIEPEDLVWQPSLPTWEPARTVEGLRFSAGLGGVEGGLSIPGRSLEQPIVLNVPVVLQPADALLRLVHRLFPAARLVRIDRRAVVTGNLAYVTAAVLIVVLLSVVGVRGGSASLIVLAFATIPIALLLGLSARLGFVLIGRTLEESKIQLIDIGVLRGFAALILGGGVIALALGIADALRGGGAVPVALGVSALLVSAYAAGTALDPAALRVEHRRSSTTGEEARSSLEVLTRLGVRLVPVSYASATVTAVVATLWLLVSAFGETPLPEWSAVWMSMRVISIAAVPMVVWLGFQVIWMLLAVVGSVIAGRDRARAR